MVILPPCSSCASSFLSGLCYPALVWAFFTCCQLLLYYSKRSSCFQTLRLFIHSPSSHHADFSSDWRRSGSTSAEIPLVAPFGLRGMWRSCVMTIRSPDLIPSPVSLLATSPLALSMSAAQKYLQVQRCIRIFIYPAFALDAPSSWQNHTFLLLPSLPPLEGCVPWGSLNLLGHGTYHLYYNCLMICVLFSALDF